jgi:hypothetical protein
MSQNLQMRSEKITCCSIEHWTSSRLSADSTLPLVIRSGMLEARAITPKLLGDSYFDMEVPVTVDLPQFGVPYLLDGGDHFKCLRMGQLINMLQCGVPCYLDQAPLSLFPEIERTLSVSAFNLAEMQSVYLWMGFGTRSGLHFDLMDNLFIQAYGQKEVILIAPVFSPCVYAFPDLPSKSSVDPEAPDFKQFPRFTRCKTLTATLLPGDVLYIPKAWWHFLRADNMSLSLNCWFGKTLSKRKRLTQYLTAGGHRVVSRWVHDFFLHGLCRQPYRRRLFSAPSLGITAYQRLFRIKHLPWIQ